MTDEFVNLETRPDGHRFLRSERYPKHGWIVEAVAEPLLDGRQFLRHAKNPDCGFIVKEQVIEGNRYLIPVDYIKNPRELTMRGVKLQ